MRAPPPRQAPVLAPVGRLAPSPTGRLHVGHARSFLLAWWHARSRGGSVRLRIEDLDAARVKPGMVDACLADLAWLGLDWDGPAHLQSSGQRELEAAVTELERAGRAYACVCSRKEVESMLSAPHADEPEPRYPGTCRGRFDGRASAERATGRAAGVRFRVPAGEVALVDCVAGPLRADVQREVGDFLLLRRDGCCAYQLAVVVDDARQGVTEVLRGDDLLPSTPRQWWLQEALGLAHPRWYHVPLVVDEDGQRLAKRRDSLALSALRARGVDSRGLVAWAARSAGQECPERATAAEVVAGFDLARLPRARTVFGAAELAALEAQRV